MSTFVEAVNNQEARTVNGMKARKSTANACVDLFYNIGASRGKNIIPAFTAAYVENSDLALRIVQWARDVRGGAGEREGDASTPLLAPSTGQPDQFPSGKRPTQPGSAAGAGRHRGADVALSSWHTAAAAGVCLGRHGLCDSPPLHRSRRNLSGDSRPSQHSRRQLGDSI